MARGLIGHMPLYFDIGRHIDFLEYRMPFSDDIARYF